MNNTNPPRRRPGTSTGSSGATPRRPPTSAASPAARRPAPAPQPDPEPEAKPSAGAKLVCTAGPKAGSEFLLSEDEVVIGRANEATVSIPDTSVSRRHAQLRKIGGGWAVSDLGSGNGTEINGSKIDEETPLRNGDVITLGDSEFSFADSANTTDRHALPVRRPGSGAAASAPPPRRPGAAPSAMRPRVSRSNMPDPEKIARRKKIQMFVALGALAFVMLLAGLHQMKAKQRAQADAVAQQERDALNHVSEIFQEGTRLVREGDWANAEKKFALVQKVKPDYPSVGDYVQRAQKEIPNQQHLADAEAALQKNQLGDASAALAQISADTQQYERLSKDKSDLEAKVPDQLTTARADFDKASAGGSKDDKIKELQEAIEMSADVLKAFPDHRDGKILHDEAKKALDLILHPPPPPPPPPARPWEAVIARYIDGDLTGSVALANACSAKGFGRCKTLLKQLTEFADLNKHPEDLHPKDLKRLLQLDRDISEGKGSKLARGAGVRAASMLYQQASAAKVAGQYGKAATALGQALQIDPHNAAAQNMLHEIKSKAHDVYLLGYSLKDQNPDEAISKFRDVIQMTPPEDEDHQKAQHWIDTLSKQ
jgi:pSer/pThr/pTyr-binding forkhead associated (FHA) protein/tetratricopeptide (TPR) repeat protein